MKSSLRLRIFFLALWLAVVLTGCEHKKQPLIVPQQQPPTVAPAASPTPEATAQPAEQQPEKTQQAEPATEQPKQEPAPAEQKESRKHAHKPSPRKPATSEKPATEVARNTTGKKIIPPDKAEPTPTPGAIAPGPTPADAHGQASTDQLLQTAESNLNGIKRTLNKDEEAMLAQIREFITQSRKATTENDPGRAYNLAVKARVLSDELVKQR
jgi:hypothetical protein